MSAVSDEEEAERLLVLPKRVLQLTYVSCSGLRWAAEVCGFGDAHLDASRLAEASRLADADFANRDAVGAERDGKTFSPCNVRLMRVRDPARARSRPDRRLSEGDMARTADKSECEAVKRVDTPR